MILDKIFLSLIGIYCMACFLFEAQAELFSSKPLMFSLFLIQTMSLSNLRISHIDAHGACNEPAGPNSKPQNHARPFF